MLYNKGNGAKEFAFTNIYFDPEKQVVKKRVVYQDEYFGGQKYKDDVVEYISYSKDAIKYLNDDVYYYKMY